VSISHLTKINRTISNNSNKEKFFKELVLFECDNLKKLNIDLDKISVFRSARHKNDMPTIFKLGNISEALNDGLIKIAENGSRLLRSNSHLIISDHLTILGKSNKAFVIAFLGGKKHLIRTEISIDKKGKFINLKVIAEINKSLKPHEKFKLEEVQLFNTDNVNEAIKYFALNKIKGIKVKQKKCPSVYCTWYYYGETITFKDCLINLKEIKRRKLPLDTFQIDDGWEDYIGDWNANKKFIDLKKVSKEINKFGLTPGIWTSPFIVDKNSKFARIHKDWLLKDSNNKLSIFPMNEKEFFIVDITIKDTWKYFEKLYKHLTKDFGFKYHKLDFTRAPITAMNANYRNKNITIVEAYRNACLSIRKGMGNAFFLMCGGLYDPLIGIVDAQRTGSDVLSMWSAANKGGKTLPFTMKQNLLRYYMNYWWYNDPDSFIVRRNKIAYKGLRFSLGLLTDNEVITSSINQILGGGLFSMTEPLNKIDDDRLKLIYSILPIKKVNIKIIDIMNCPRYPNLIQINNNYLAVINFDDNKTLIKTISSKEILGKGNSKTTIKLEPHASTILKLTGKKIIQVDNNIDY